MGSRSHTANGQWHAANIAKLKRRIARLQKELRRLQGRRGPDCGNKKGLRYL